MTTIYVAQNSGVRKDEWTDDAPKHVAFPQAQAAKSAALEAHRKDSAVHNVMKIVLKKGVGIREMMCALFNNDMDGVTETSEIIYTAPTRRGRPVDREETLPEANDEDLSQI